MASKELSLKSSNYGYNKHSPSQQVPQHITKVQSKVMRIVVNFHCKFFIETKARVNNMEHGITKEETKFLGLTRGVI